MFLQTAERQLRVHNEGHVLGKLCACAALPSQPRSPRSQRLSRPLRAIAEALDSLVPELHPVANGLVAAERARLGTWGSWRPQLASPPKPAGIPYHVGPSTPGRSQSVRRGHASGPFLPPQTPFSPAWGFLPFPNVPAHLRWIQWTDSCLCPSFSVAMPIKDLKTNELGKKKEEGGKQDLNKVITHK